MRMLLLPGMLGLLLPLVFAQETPNAGEVSVPDTGQMEFDTRLPAEIQLDGRTVAKLYGPGVFSMRAEVGEHDVLVLTNGTPRPLKVDVSRTATAVVLVGRNGLTATARLEPLPEEEGITPVEVRVVGTEEVLVQIGKERFRLKPGAFRSLTVPVGRHAMRVKSSSGTVLWASGFLELTRTEPVVLQITEGRMPEVSGSGSSFVAGS